MFIVVLQVPFIVEYFVLIYLFCVNLIFFSCDFGVYEVSCHSSSIHGAINFIVYSQKNVTVKGAVMPFCDRCENFMSNLLTDSYIHFTTFSFNLTGIEEVYDRTIKYILEYQI